MSQNLKLGDVVAVKSHPYYHSNREIIISGDVVNLSPLMVVSEVSISSRDEHDEMTGEKISTKGDGKCKCTWYSLKANSFEYAWFPFESLKLIEEDTKDKLEIPKDQPLTDLVKKYKAIFKNTFVLFKTTPYELEKQKITMNFTDKSSSKKSVYNSLLSFVCPPLEIIDIKLNTTKANEKKYDLKTGARTSLYPEIEVKCRFYNGSSAKWSEFILPFESLIKLDTPDEKIIKGIKKSITDKNYYRFKINDLRKINMDDRCLVESLKRSLEPTIVFEPEELIYLNGMYFLKGKDLIHNKILRFRLTDLFGDIIQDELTEEDLFEKDSYPDFNFKKGQKSRLGDKLFTELSEFCENASNESKYIVLNYINKRDDIITKTLKNYFTVDKPGEKGPQYLHGHCCDKGGPRSFRFNGIQSIRILNLGYSSVDETGSNVNESALSEEGSF